MDSVTPSPDLARGGRGGAAAAGRTAEPAGGRAGAQIRWTLPQIWRAGVLAVGCGSGSHQGAGAAAGKAQGAAVGSRLVALQGVRATLPGWHQGAATGGAPARGALGCAGDAPLMAVPQLHQSHCLLCRRVVVLVRRETASRASVLARGTTAATRSWVGVLRQTPAC